MFKKILPLILVLSQSAFAQVKINEYCAANISVATDQFGEYEDWIELYNTSASTLNLSGYYLSDNPNKPLKWRFSTISIPPNGYLVVYCSGRDTIQNNEPHTNFKLTQTKGTEYIILSNSAGTLVDSIWIRRHQKNHSWGRSGDGASTWNVFTTPTPGASNSGGKTRYVATPQFSLQAGFYTSSQTVTITCSDANATIYYTTDGSTPTQSSTQYTGPITVSQTTVLRARAFSSDPNLLPSFIETNTYFINVSHVVPVLSIAGDQIETLLNGSQIEPEGSIEYFDKTKSFKAEAVGEFNEHGNDSWAYAQRGFDYITRDQFGYNYGVNDKIFTHRKRKSFQRLIIKAAANDNYPFGVGGNLGPAHIRDAYVHTLAHLADLRMDYRIYEPCILYVNGKYWGVYEIREKADDSDFTSYYYDQDEKYSGSPIWLQYLKTWGSTWSEYGGSQAQADWNNFKNFVLSNNMAIMSNYDSVKKVYNVGSLIDYVVLNSYVVCTDWLNWNTAWWRGLNPNGDKKKWRYVLWDMDATFDHYINYTGVPSTAPNADPCNPESLNDPGGQGHIPILNALLANDTFRQEYITRFIDLNNTYFSCSSMLAILDSLIAQIDPEMNGQISKWGGTYAGWQQNVQDMKNFIQARCDSINQGLKNCYNVKGPYDLIVDVNPVGAGKVKINSIWAPNYPFTAQYFGGIHTILEAKAFNGYVFDHWEFKNGHTFIPNDSSLIVKFDIDTFPEHVVAHFRAVETPEDTTPSLNGELAVPNAFSPNGDGKNDILYLLGKKDIVSVELWIYTRWGEQVFYTNDYSIGWDGTYKGKPVDTGVYVYRLKATKKDGTKINRTGNITLIR